MVLGTTGWSDSEHGWRKGPWTPAEDKLLTEYVSLHGEGRWSSVARTAGIYVILYNNSRIYTIIRAQFLYFLLNYDIPKLMIFY